VHLTNRFDNKEVYLVGSANQSTMLAQRTQKLIEELKPDKVMVQTSPEWWSNVRLMNYVDSQEEMDTYAPELDRWSNMRSFDFYYNNRRWLALARLGFYRVFLRMFFGF